MDTVQKVGSKYFVHVEILKAFGAELEKLPKKEKILYDFKSAVAFLRPFLELAIEKNYTKDEIFDIIGKVGWQMNRTTFKHFWNLYSLEEENSGKKKSRSKKSSGKTILKVLEKFQKLLHRDFEKFLINHISFSSANAKNVQ